MAPPHLAVSRSFVPGRDGSLSLPTIVPAGRHFSPSRPAIGAGPARALGVHPWAPRTSSTTEGSGGAALAARHHNRATGVEDHAPGDASLEPALYGAQSPAPHDEQADVIVLLAMTEYLVVRIAHPQVRLRDGAPGFLYLLHSLLERLLGS